MVQIITTTATTNNNNDDRDYNFKMNDMFSLQWYHVSREEKQEFGIKEVVNGQITAVKGLRH